MRELLAASFQRDFDRFNEELMKKRKETKKSPLRPSALTAIIQLMQGSLAIRYGRTYGEVYVQASGVCSESDGTRRLDDRQRRRLFTPGPGATTH